MRSGVMLDNTLSLLVTKMDAGKLGLGVVVYDTRLSAFLLMSAYFS